LKAFNILPDAVFTSLLSRSKDTYKEIMNIIPVLARIPVINSWRLNERHYGSLVGLSKEEAGRKMGVEKVMEWRRCDLPNNWR
jgi:2,3-bisphosphoglycerate-dependent phosphoglycerate mutase